MTSLLPSDAGPHHNLHVGQITAPPGPGRNMLVNTCDVGRRAAHQTGVNCITPTSGSTVEEKDTSEKGHNWWEEASG